MPADETPLPAPPAYVSGMREIADHYDGFILDVWGVLHNGIAPFPGVIDCLERLGGAGKPLCVLSNAPPRAVDFDKRPEQVGLERPGSHEVLSSGEATWRSLDRLDEPF